MGREGGGYDCELMAPSSSLLVKEDLSSRLEQIDLSSSHHKKRASAIPAREDRSAIIPKASLFFKRS
jgi:hypothetical protein